MKKTKAIFCDLDGTLLNSRGRLSKESSSALIEIEKMGVIFVPTTGRSFYEMPASVCEHPAIRYYLNSNGAVLYDKQTGSRSCILMSGATVKEIMAVLSPYEVLYVNHYDGIGAIDSSLLSEQALASYNLEPYFLQHILENAEGVSNFFDIFEKGRDTEMVCAFFRDHSVVKEACARLSSVAGIRITTSSRGSIEIISDRAGKANAVLAAAQELGVARDEFIVVGDSGNDLGMLALTDNSYAMQNAPDHVKAAAKQLACHNDEHVAEFLLGVLKKENER